MKELIKYILKNPDVIKELTSIKEFDSDIVVDEIFDNLDSDEIKLKDFIYIALYNYVMIVLHKEKYNSVFDEHLLMNRVDFYTEYVNIEPYQSSYKIAFKKDKVFTELDETQSFIYRRLDYLNLIYLVDELDNELLNYYN